MVRAVVAFRDRGDTDLAEAAAILEDVTADQLEAVLMVALGLAVQLGVALSVRYSANIQSKVPTAATASMGASEAPPVCHASNAGSSTVSARATAVS